MRLIFFTVENFRRFVGPTSVKLHGDLISLIGPNEAGKSSILDALALLDSDEPFARSDQPRRSGKVPRLSWGFQLEDGDKEALAELPEAASLNRVVITKGADGGRRWEFFPTRPIRDRSSRQTLIQQIRDFLAEPAVIEIPRDEEDDLRDRLRELLDRLAEDSDDLGTDTVNMLGLAIADVETLDLSFERDDDEDLSEEDREQEEALLGLQDKLSDALRSQARRESGVNPATRARSALESRLPSMILYRQVDRDLQGSFDLEQVADAPPRALGHLTTLADLNLVELRREIQEGLSADVATRRDRANRTLRRAFDTAWNQQKVALQIHLDGTTLFIHAMSLDAIDAGMSELSERSDGMRWFASLLAFVHGWPQKPILLVDEIETHLHYDAQADLVNVLSRQEFTGKVIYTTHSFGCLPPDIGMGIRLVEPIDETTSQLVNGFWRNGYGFSPLLTSMGAAAVSFTPSRHAVMVEGPSDAVLLPTLLRQATEPDSALGFQIAPGVAEVAAAKSEGLGAEAGRVVFLVDGDAGGLANRDKLIEGAIDPDAIVVLLGGAGEGTGGLEVEDLVDADLYAAAVNAELACWYENPPEVTTADLGPTLRPKALSEWCKANSLSPPDKVAVAERLIEIATEKPIFENDRKEFIKQLRSDLALRLRLK